MPPEYSPLVEPKPIKVWVLHWENRDDLCDDVQLFRTKEQAQMVMFNEFLMHQQEGKRVIIDSMTSGRVYRTDDYIHDDDWISDHEELLFQSGIVEQEVK